MDSHFQDTGDKCQSLRQNDRSYWVHNSPQRLLSQCKYYSEDMNIKAAKFENVQKMHNGILQKKASYEKTIEEYFTTKIKLHSLQKISTFLTQSSQIQQLRQKPAAIKNQLLLALSAQQSTIKKLEQQHAAIKNYSFSLTNHHQQLMKVQQLEQMLHFKKMELDQLLEEEMAEFTEFDKIETISKKIQEKQSACKMLKSEQLEIKTRIKELREKRFEINQRFSKQERINYDLRLQILDMNEKIKKQAQLDQKLRIENLKKMQECEANKLHPDDLPYEDLRKLKEKKHELKLLLLKVQQSYEDQRELNKNLIPKALSDQLINKIEKAEKFVRKNQMADENNKILKEKIQAGKQEIIRLKNEMLEVDTVEVDRAIQRQENCLIELKANMKVLKKEAENLSAKLKDFTSVYPSVGPCVKNEQLETEIQVLALKQSKRKLMKKTPGELEKEETENTLSNRNTALEVEQKSQISSVCSNLPQEGGFETSSSSLKKIESEISDEKMATKSAHTKLSMRKKCEIKTLSKNDSRQDMVYICKPRNWNSFTFTLVYLLLLVIFGHYYNKIRVYVMIYT